MTDNVYNHPEILKNEDYIDLISSFSHAELVEFLAGELPQNPRLVNKLKLFESKHEFFRKN